MTGIVCLALETFVIIPWVLILARIIDGLSNGLFWPNLFNQLSEWQKVTNLKDSERNFKIFNNAWSFGLCTGYLVGFALVLIWKNNLIITSQEL